jgi:hypothetical protein
MNTAAASASPVVSTPAPRRIRWWRHALWLALGLGVLMLVAAFTLLDHADLAPLQITVNGESMVTDLNLAALPPAHKVVLAVVIALMLLLALLVALCGVVVALVLLVPIVLLTVGLPVLVGGAVVLVVFSPLLLLAWLLWRAVRPAPRSTTMPA